MVCLCEKYFYATATSVAMAPPNTTTATGRAILTSLSRSFKNVLISSEARKGNQDTPKITQALSQAAGNPKSHFAIITVNRCHTYFEKAQESQDPILI